MFKPILKCFFIFLFLRNGYCANRRKSNRRPNCLEGNIDMLAFFVLLHIVFPWNLSQTYIHDISYTPKTILINIYILTLSLCLDNMDNTFHLWVSKKNCNTCTCIFKQVILVDIIPLVSWSNAGISASYVMKCFIIIPFFLYYSLL